jgi:hypothetical protein
VNNSLSASLMLAVGLFFCGGVLGANEPVTLERAVERALEYNSACAVNQFPFRRHNEMPRTPGTSYIRALPSNQVYQKQIHWNQTGAFLPAFNQP